MVKSSFIEENDILHGAYPTFEWFWIFFHFLIYCEKYHNSINIILVDESIIKYIF
jgi:hypothetical protein